MLVILVQPVAAQTIARGCGILTNIATGVASHSDTEREGPLNGHGYSCELNVPQWHNNKYDPQLPAVDSDLPDEPHGVIGQLNDLQRMRSVHSMRGMELEQRAIWLEAEVRRKEEETSPKEEEVRKKKEERRSAPT